MPWGCYTRHHPRKRFSACNVEDIALETSHRSGSRLQLQPDSASYGMTDELPKMNYLKVGSTVRTVTRCPGTAFHGCYAIEEDFEPLSSWLKLIG